MTGATLCVAATTLNLPLQLRPVEQSRQRAHGRVAPRGTRPTEPLSARQNEAPVRLAAFRGKLASPVFSVCR